MVEPGIRLKAIVTRVDEYGVWLDYQGQQVLILVPELSWSPVQTRDVVQVGKEIELLVLGYNKDHVIVGSVRRVDPEKNPYRSLSRLGPDTVLTGVVKGHSARDARVDFSNGAIGYIRPSPIPLKKGDHVQVTVADLDVDEGHLTLKLVRPVPGAAVNIANSIVQMLASSQEELKP